MCRSRTHTITSNRSIMNLEIAVCTSYFWNYLMGAFGWNFMRPGDIFVLLYMVLSGHPFKRKKKFVWKCFVRAFLWDIWLERNASIFIDKSGDYDHFVDSTTLLAINWSKFSSPFSNYNLSTFINHWRSFL